MSHLLWCYGLQKDSPDWLLTQQWQGRVSHLALTSLTIGEKGNLHNFEAHIKLKINCILILRCSAAGSHHTQTPRLNQHFKVFYGALYFWEGSQRSGLARLHLHGSEIGSLLVHLENKGDTLSDRYPSLYKTEESPFFLHSGSRKINTLEHQRQ